MINLIKNKIEKLINNKYVEIFLIFLILFNFVLFIFQTDINFHNHFYKYINKIETYSIIIFTIEYVLRVITLKNLKELFKPIMIIDFVAIVPFYLSFVSTNTIFLRILRCVRIFRIAKLAWYTTAWRKIKKSFLKRKDELIVTFIIFILGLTTASIAIYFAEHNTGNVAFSSVPSSFWWSVVTCTSVGYGDTYPITTLGKFIGAFTAVMGVCLHALLIGVVGAAFMEITKED